MKHCPFSIINFACDRLFEARWHLDNAKQEYHKPDGFRYSINAFIRCTKEIPGMISKEMQNKSNYQSEIKPILDELNKNPLFQILKKKRDFIVHQGKLEMQSTGRIGTTELRVDKISIPFPVHPNEPSSQAYKRFLDTCKREPVYRSLVTPDCDSLPFLERTWKIEEFEDDVFDICANSFNALAMAINQIVTLEGTLGFDLESMGLGSSNDIKRIVYDRDEFHEYMNS
ncbi:MAG: hypothetical protein HGB15_01215 [Chlorobaculum sp.]|jgi:hypothetical protein|nr:hypothetical protein [Chlorobaculum sp.]